MKLNYREKVILAVFLALAILVGGFFGLVKPKNDTIKTDKKTLSTEREKEKEVKAKIAQIGTLQDTIKQLVKDTTEITDHFVDKSKDENPVLLDEFMQHFADENEIRITNLAVGDMTEKTLDYYYIEVNEIGSGLRELADFTGDYLENTNEQQAEQNQLSQREKPTVLEQVYVFEGKGKKESLWKLMDAINDYSDALLITSVEYDKVQEEGEDGNQKPDDEKSDEEREIKPEDEVSIKMNISLYSVYDLIMPEYEDAE